MPSREELLQSIKPGMKLNRAFFFRVYGGLSSKVCKFFFTPLSAA